MPLTVIREGAGPEILLVHGGASPPTTWRGLEPLRDRWTLAFVYRRGYPPSPREPDERQDFLVDADDLEPLLQSRPHVVAHSYGALGALIAATRRPDLARSLTFLEPPFYLPAGDPEVERFRRIGDTVLEHGLETEPATLREFLRVAGAVVDDGPLSAAVERGVRRAHGGRPPSEARLDFAPVRDAGVPALVASGGHTPAVERMCDGAARELRAQRVVAPGAGHFVAAAPGFAEHLEAFLKGPDPFR